jgi:catalase
VIGPEEAVEAVHERFGRHQGRRALHAKGNFYRATFNATVDAARLTRAAHMQGQGVDATVRFSNGSGDPTWPDNIADIRGMAVTFHLPDGSRTDISAQSVPRFPVSTPEAFIELLRATDRSAGSLWRFPLFVARHPRVVSTLTINADALRPPSSYAGIPYYAVHAFKWIDPRGAERHVRYRWEPEQTEPRLAKLEARGRGPDYLQEELRQRLSRGPVQFSLMLQLAAQGDPVDDPAAAWPEDRETVTAGILKVTDVQAVDETSAPLVFDPTRVTDGIELSNDPVLLFRPRAYAVSAQRRTGRATPAT